MNRWMLFVALATSVPAVAGVSVTAPVNNSNVATTVQYAATATTSCAHGVSAMGIYTAPGVLAYTVGGAELKTELTLNPGTYNTVVQEWDNCGGASKTPVKITVGGPVKVTAPANGSSVGSPVQFSGWSGGDGNLYGSWSAGLQGQRSQSECSFDTQRGKLSNRG